MNGKRVNVEELIACGNVFDSFFIDDRMGQSDKAFHDCTTCGRLFTETITPEYEKEAFKQNKEIQSMGNCL